MIRALWLLLNVALATVAFGTIAIVASLLRLRGRIYYWCTREWSRAIVWSTGAPVRTVGLERVDWTRPHVLVSNHTSVFDIVALASVLPAPFHFVGKKELNRIPLFGTAWRAAGHISIDRSNRKAALEGLARAGERIRRDGGIIIVFPEGTRSRDGQLRPFKNGAFVLSAQAEIPVIPVMIRGTNRLQVPGRLAIRPHPIELVFGEALAADAEDGAAVNPFVARVRARMLAMESEGR